MNERLPALRKKAMTLPPLPGVYLMKDGKGRVIYIGKAKALKNRVSSYFGSSAGHASKVRAMVGHTADFDYIVTQSEHEALVLECSLIKQHTPKYNILLRDDKGYRWIRVTNEVWPRLSVAKQKPKTDDGAQYLGPYTSAFAVKLAVDEAREVCRLPQCGKQFPRDIGKGRPCLHYFIEKCAAPCAGKLSQAAYAQAVREAVDFLRQGSARSIQDLRERMDRAAEALDFEQAARLRDLIKAIERIMDKQHVVSVSVEEQDVFALAAERSQACWMVLRFMGGKLHDSEHFLLERPEALPEARRELLERYYAMRQDRLPKRILLDGETEGVELLEQWLSGLAGHRVRLQVARKGEPLRLTELAAKNALEQLAHRTGRQSKTIAALEELAGLLGLSSPPEYIEAYDISHTGGSDNVAGMVVFRGGLPHKAAYRRFAIKGFEGQDDYASMAEVLGRRLARYKEAQGGGQEEGFGRLPDLILLDGGIGQVRAVEPVLRQYGLSIPLFGMVKDSKHRTRAISSGGGELQLSAARQAFALVTAIQDEAHRFAVTYHRQKHGQRSLRSALTEIPGIGPARAAALLREFKTMKAIRAAGVEELKAVKGMNETAARAVKDGLR
ncbi:MAG: excinuclease ABC subunit UvrC [Oscillospiraceae bacterium]|nr:excinuclease ABC subunit UvrC [Oscillospiraceae bacterium]